MEPDWTAPNEPDMPDEPSIEVSDMDMTVDQYPQHIMDEKKKTRSARQARRKRAKGTALVELALLPPRTIIDSNKLAEMLGVARRTISGMAKEGRIPPGRSLIGNSLHWTAGQILDWFEQH